MASSKPPDTMSDSLAATYAGNDLANDATPIAVASSFEERFRIEGELARGGMGRVVIATDTTLRREVAIKELLESDHSVLAQRFEREALLTARLQHPGVVGVYDFARQVNGVAALIMRRVRGRPFDEAMSAATTREQRLELLAPFISACDAVAYAHREGVIHRDLKPANVLLGDFGDTVVIDWGLAKDIRARADLSGTVDSIPTPNAALTMAGALMGNLATAEYRVHDYANAEKVQVEVLESMEKIFGPSSNDTIITLGSLANTYSAEKKYAQAEAMHMKAVAALRATVGPKAPDTLVELYNLACTVALEGQPDRALGYLTEAVDGGLPRGIDIAQDSDLQSLHGLPAFEALRTRSKPN